MRRLIAFFSLIGAAGSLSACGQTQVPTAATNARAAAVSTVDPSASPAPAPQPSPTPQPTLPANPTTTTITFSGLSALTAPFAQSGYTVTPVSGSWNVIAYGDPGPSIQISSAAGVSTTGEITVDAGGQAFQFLSVDLYSSVTTIPYVITGKLRGQPAWTLAATMAQTFGDFRPLANPNTGLIDQLSIVLTDAAPPCCPNPVGLDKITLRK